MTAKYSSDRLFNTPLESGLRSLFLLDAVRPSACDLQRLVIYDYLLVHSDDVADGPTALHPRTPMRSGELLVRRNLVESGLRLMISKGLAQKAFTLEGIVYVATDLVGEFLGYLQSPYAARCGEISRWIADRFQPLTNDQLNQFINDHLGRWGAEFTRDSVLWEDVE